MNQEFEYIIFGIRGSTDKVRFSLIIINILILIWLLLI